MRLWEFGLFFLPGIRPDGGPEVSTPQPSPPHFAASEIKSNISWKHM